MRNRSVTYSAEATFHALADPTRRAVLDLLRNRGATGGADRGIVSGFEAGHLQAFAASLADGSAPVVEHRRGRHRFYRARILRLSKPSTRGLSVIAASGR